MLAQKSYLGSTKIIKSAFNITLVQPQTYLLLDDTPPPIYDDIPQKNPSQSSLPHSTSVFQERPDHRTHHIYTDYKTTTIQVGSDQTGRFIFPSTSGNNYISVLYDYNSNSIHVEPIPNRIQESIKDAYSKVLRLSQLRGLRPKLHRLNNEASHPLKYFINDKNVDYQITTEGIHRLKWVERSIQTLKNNFISVLCSTHPDLPLNLWDKFLPQATLNLNLLCPSSINLQLSSHSQNHGSFNFDKTPLAPPGIKVLTHERD